MKSIVKMCKACGSEKPFGRVPCPTCGHGSECQPKMDLNFSGHYYSAPVQQNTMNLSVVGTVEPEEKEPRPLYGRGVSNFISVLTVVCGLTVSAFFVFMFTVVFLAIVRQH